MDSFGTAEMADWLKYLGSSSGALAVGAATATIAGLWYINRPVVREHAHLQQQSVPVPGVPGARMSVLCKDGKLLEEYYDDANTYYSAFLRGARVSNNGQCLGWREGSSPYKWLKYETVIERSHHVGSGFIHAGLSAENSTRVGLYSQNRVEYILTQLGCSAYSMVVIPLYDTLGPDSVKYIINQAEIKLVVVDKYARMKILLNNINSTSKLEVIISMEPFTIADAQLARNNNIVLLLFAVMERNGSKNPVAINPAKKNDIYTICYTSGTTGNPKGAILSHGNLTAVVAAQSSNLEFFEVSPDDVLISYLPLAHVYQQSVELFTYSAGAQVGFYRGDIKLLMEDIAELKPTLFPSVPRLLNRVYDKVLSSVSQSKIKKFLFDCAMSSKLKEVRQGIVRRDSIWDSIIFKKVQSTLGGRVRLITSGSAPISPQVLNFVRVATGSHVLEGYGQTEGGGVQTLQMEGEGEAGHVGPPLPCCMIKMVDVPDMNYYAEDGQGEVCIKGPNVFSGYLKEPEKTAEALDADGWLHTGDVGEWTPNKALRIIDRKKHIFKLAQGEYIAPEKIENIYSRSLLVQQVFVYGNSLQACLVGVVVVKAEALSQWASENLSLKESTYDQLCAREDINKAILDDLVMIGKKSGLHSFEQVKAIYIHPEPFSVENGLLTPTFKTKRNDVAKLFAPQFEDMYRKLAY